MALLGAGCFSPSPADHLYACATTSQCPSGYECAQGWCYRQGHVPQMSDPCRDGVQDGDETGVDCGGPTCPQKCPVGQGCSLGADCTSNICNVMTNVCAADACSDGMRDGSETDVDCGGGTCPACPAGKACINPGDCTNLLCNQTSHTCVADPCFDGTQDGTETDIDCGGLCAQKCKNGEGCRTAQDCVTGATCVGTPLKCEIPHCVNGVKDPGETDVDCGGPDCSPCALGKSCTSGSDCASTFCNAVTHVCVANQCQDGVKDGTESGVDCGGSSTSCPRCPNGQTCSGMSDCVSGAICTATGVCCTPSGTACNGLACGTATDNCGQAFNCGPMGGACPTGQLCSGGCCALTMTSACSGKQCGSVSDGCNGSYDCGTCASGSTCSNAPNYLCCAGVASACSGVAGCTVVSTSCGSITCPCPNSGDVCYNGACCTPDYSVCDGCTPGSAGCGKNCSVKKCSLSQICCPGTGCVPSNQCL